MPAQRLILPPSYATLQEERRRKHAATVICRSYIQAIQQSYPGHQFEVTATIGPQGQCSLVVEYPGITDKVRGKPVGFRVHDAGDFKTVLKFCGEILERAGLPRRKLDDVNLVIDAGKHADVAFGAK